MAAAAAMAAASQPTVQRRAPPRGLAGPGRWLDPRKTRSWWAARSSRPPPPPARCRRGRGQAGPVLAVRPVLAGRPVPAGDRVPADRPVLAGRPVPAGGRVLADRRDGVRDEFGNRKHGRVDEVGVRGPWPWTGPGKLIGRPVPRDADRRGNHGQFEPAATRLRPFPRRDSRAVRGPVCHRSLPVRSKCGVYPGILHSPSCEPPCQRPGSVAGTGDLLPT